MESENRKPLFTKRLLLIVVAVILLVLIVFLLLKRCGNSGNSKVEQITLTPTRVNLKVGEQQQVYSNVYPEDAKDSSVYWDSEDPTIASVDQNGVVTGINNGVTTITAKANDSGGAVGSTTVTVGDDLPELEQIQLNKSIYTVKVGSTVLIEATPVPSTAQLLDIKYSIRDTNIATVDSSGRIKGVKVGSTIVTITANEGKVQTTATVKVVENSSGGTTNTNTPSDAKIPVSAISLTATETCYKLKVGNSYTIETKILPNDATDKTLTWEVVSAEDASDAAKNKVAKTYASVSNTGVVKGLKVGNVKIKITAKSGVYSYFDIKVISSGNEGYCTTNNNGSSSGGGENGSNPSGGGTKVAAPKSVDFKCGTSVYTDPCQYNVGILITLGDAKLGTNFDKFYTCLSKNGSNCTPNKASDTSAPAYESITKTGTYVYCVQLEFKGKRGAKVCSAKKEIKIEKSQTGKSLSITGSATVKSGSSITLTAVATGFEPTNYTWSSSNTKCASVSGGGTIATGTVSGVDSITGDCTAIITLKVTDKNGKSLSDTKTIKVEKSQTSESIKTPTIEASSNNKTYTSRSWTNGTVDIVLKGASEDEAYYRSSTKVPTGNKEKISDEGINNITYKICKKSNPSICGNSTAITIKIDKTAPSCGKIVGAGSSSNWTKRALISVACSDTHSGCVESSYVKSWNSTITVGYIPIKDNAGNTTYCPVNAYVDTDSPEITCKVISESKDGVGVKVTASDAASGLDKDPSGTKGIRTSTTYSAEDKVGNSASCTITVTEDATYQNQQKRYPCIKPTWKDANTTWEKSCSASNSSSSNTSSYTTCQYITDASVCLSNGRNAPCYMKNTYDRKGCGGYSQTPDDIEYPPSCGSGSNQQNNYHRFTCSKITASKIYRGKVSY